MAVNQTTNDRIHSAIGLIDDGSPHKARAILADLIGEDGDGARVGHTPEPWSVDPHYRGDIMAGHCNVAMVFSREDIGKEFMTKEPCVPDSECSPNARRIVACVNACAGINPDAVPELLAACEALANDVDGCELDSAMVDARNRAVAAIAKAKGGAA